MDTEAAVYIEIKLDWDYVHRNVTLLMPNYIQPILRGVQEYPPDTCAPIQYLQKIQYADPLDAADYVSYKETNLIQQVCGTLL